MSKTAATTPAARAREFFRMQEQAQFIAEEALLDHAEIAGEAAEAVKDKLGEAFKSDAFKDSVDGVITKALEEFFKDEDDEPEDEPDEEAADAAVDAAELVAIKGGVIEASGTALINLLDAAAIAEGHPVRIVFEGEVEWGKTTDKKTKKQFRLLIAEGQPIAADELPRVEGYNS